MKPLIKGAVIMVVAALTSLLLIRVANALALSNEGIKFSDGTIQTTAATQTHNQCSTLTVVPEIEQNVYLLPHFAEDITSPRAGQTGTDIILHFAYAGAWVPGDLSAGVNVYLYDPSGSVLVGPEGPGDMVCSPCWFPLQNHEKKSIDLHSVIYTNGGSVVPTTEGSVLLEVDGDADRVSIMVETIQSC